MNIYDLICDLIKLANELPHRDEIKLDALKKRSEMIIRNLLGESSQYIKDLKKISFYPTFSSADEKDCNEYWNSGKNELLNLLTTLSDEIQIFNVNSKNNFINNNINENKNISNQIFIVHGHDDALKHSVARFLEKLDLKPIILHEQPDQGRTIIEKFTEYSNVPFAIILLSPDDIAHSKNTPNIEETRARQNVIFEFGFFIGKLGRNRVMILYKHENNFKFPSDYQGVLYIPIDEHEGWKTKVLKELKTFGYTIDANTILS